MKTARKGSVAAFVNSIREKAPAYVDLLVAKTEADFESAFDRILEAAVARLEQNKKHYHVDGEEKLSATLAGFISCEGLSAIAEAYSNGHVDITIEATHSTPLRRKLAEAKIYDGPAYHIQGLGQLIDRYTTGRETRGLIIAYVKKPDIEGLVLKLRSAMNTQKPMNQKGSTVDHPQKWSFVSTHKLKSGNDHDVRHVACNLHV